MLLSIVQRLLFGCTDGDDGDNDDDDDDHDDNNDNNIATTAATVQFESDGLVLLPPIRRSSATNACDIRW